MYAFPAHRKMIRTQKLESSQTESTSNHQRQFPQPTKYLKPKLPEIKPLRPETSQGRDVPLQQANLLDKKYAKYVLQENNQRKLALQKLRKGSVNSSSSIPRRVNSDLLEDYTIGGVIGKGSYAVVKSALCSTTSTRVAIKVYEKIKLHDPMKKKNVQREIAILRQMDHPNIIKLIKTIDTANQLNLVMEYGGSISLKEYVRQRGGKLPENEARDIFKQLLSAIAYIHSKGVVHRDLKLENILLDEQKTVKLIDFGFAIIPDAKIRIFCGTPSYMAPEIISKSISYGTPVDVWACGVILYYLLVGVLPFKAPNERELYKKIETGLYKKQAIESQGGLNLMEKLLNTNQTGRVTAENVQHNNPHHRP